MSSKARNFRRRGGDNDGDDETTTAPKPPPPPPSTATKPKKKSLLSFVDDEEEEEGSGTTTPFSTRPVSKPAPNSSTRKSSSSSGSHHKLVSSKDRSTPTSTPKSSSNVQPQAGTYTKEALLELQKNTKTLAPRSRSSARPEPKPGLVEPVIVLKGLVKPVGSAGMNERKDSESENEVERDTIDKLGSMGVEEIGGGGIIPDRATIEAIRAKRERLRQVRAAAPDYIALDEGGNHGEAEGLSDEEPEFQGRIGFYGEKIDKRGVFEDFEDKVIEKEASGVVESYGSEDEEDKMWEEEQVRKGLGKRMDDGGPNKGGVTSVSAPPVVVQSSVEKVKFGNSASMYSSVQSVAHTIGGAVGGLPNLDVMSISQKADLAKRALLQNMGRLKESHGRTVASLCKTEENLAASLSNVTALENSLSAAGEKYIFMQKLRDFVSVICAFLQDKAPYIEELEDQVLELHKERAAAIVERRAADNNDEMKELEAAVSAARQVFSKGGSNVATIEAATAAALAATAAMRKGGDLPVKLDEFGRDVNLQKRMDMSRRAEARKCRRAKNDVKRVSAIRQDSAYQSVEGESSTDESDSESNAYQSNRDQLLQVAEQIFGDTHEEYSQLSVVMEKFDTWKKEYASSYRDAYMSLAIPSIFSPYVRLELLKWDPLHGKNADFTKMEWYELLYNYGLPKDENEISPDDADANLVPELVEKLAIPILHNHLTYCWDMLSTRETQCAVSAIKLVLTFGPFGGPAISNLAALLRDRLADAVTNLTVPTWDSLVLKAVPDAARVAAYRFGMSIRLMRNICLLHGILATPILEKLVLDELLSGKVLPHLRSIQANSHDALMRTERVVASLNGVWTGPSVTGVCSPKLRPLVDYLLKLGRGLEKEHVSGSGESKTAKSARRLKRMLVELNEYDHARDISRTFNLKEAL